MTSQQQGDRVLMYCDRNDVNLSEAAMPQVVMGKVALRLDDGAVPTVTLLRDASGGSTFANVVRQSGPNDHFARKRLGSPSIEDFVVNVATPSSSGLVQWIAASWGPKMSTRSGALLTCAADSTIARGRPSIVDGATADGAIRGAIVGDGTARGSGTTTEARRSTRDSPAATPDSGGAVNSRGAVDGVASDGGGTLCST